MAPNPNDPVLEYMRVKGIEMTRENYIAYAFGDGDDIDLDDLRARVQEHRENLAAIMVTYPSTNGILTHLGKVLLQKTWNF